MRARIPAQSARERITTPFDANSHMSLGRGKADRRNPAFGEVHDNTAFLPIPAGKVGLLGNNQAIEPAAL